MILKDGNIWHRPIEYFRKLPKDNCKVEFYDDEWADRYHIRYKFDDQTGVLRITMPNSICPETIVEHINSLKLVKAVIIKVLSDKNETAAFNSLCDVLKRFKSNKPITLDLKGKEFGNFVALDIIGLPSNVRVTSYGDEDTPYYGEESFDWWCLNQDEESYSKILGSLTTKAKERITYLRGIAKWFNDYSLKCCMHRESVISRTSFAFRWVSNCTTYDKESTNSDGTLKYDCKYSQDPVQTYKRRSGVCVGRATLLKVLLNNYYQKVPCYLVSGYHGSLPHEWNEIVLNGVSYYYDTSFNEQALLSLPSAYKELKHDDAVINGALCCSTLVRKRQQKKVDSND